MNFIYPHKIGMYSRVYMTPDIGYAAIKACEKTADYLWTNEGGIFIFENPAEKVYIYEIKPKSSFEQIYLNENYRIPEYMSKTKVKFAQKYEYALEQIAKILQDHPRNEPKYPSKLISWQVAIKARTPTLDTMKQIESLKLCHRCHDLRNISEFNTLIKSYLEFVI